MRLCKSFKLLLMLGALLLAACGQQQASDHSEYQLQVAVAHLNHSENEQRLQLGLSHQFSPTLVEALHSGVVLSYAWQLELMDADGSPWQTRRWLDSGSLNVSYRSFTQWYTLSQQPSNQTKDYPDLERTRQALETMSLLVHIPPELMTTDSPYRFRFRIYLDINQLPPPLRLPAYVNSAWRLDSGWHEWWPESTTVAVDYVEFKANK